MDHQSEDTHLSGTSLVELNSTLLELRFGVKLVPSKVNESISEITRELSLSSDVLHDEKLQEANEANNLGKSLSWDGGEGSKASRDRGEGVTGKVNVSRKANSSSRNKISDNS